MTDSVQAVQMQHGYPYFFVVDGLKVPYLTGEPTETEGVWKLTLDNRTLLLIQWQTLVTMLPFIAHCMAVAAGYTHFGGDKANIFAQPVLFKMPEPEPEKAPELSLEDEKPVLNGKETKLCPDCQLIMILRRTNMTLTSNPPQYPMEWWCGNCNHTEPGPTLKGETTHDIEMRRWRDANFPKTETGD